MTDIDLEWLTYTLQRDAELIAHHTLHGNDALAEQYIHDSDYTARYGLWKALQ